MGAGSGLQVVLTALNSQYVHSALAPWCLRAGIIAYGRYAHQPRVVEGTVNEPPEAVAQRITSVTPQVLAICCYIWNIEYVRALLPILRSRLPDCSIVLGGPEVSYNAAEVLLTCPQADYVIIGEGEQALALLADALAEGGDPGSLHGLCYRRPEGTAINPPGPALREPPSPYCPEYFDSLQGRMAYLETSRGCPFSCAFCLSGRDDSPRYFPLPRVFEEINALAHSGARTIKLVDRTFNANSRRADAILAHILGLDLPEGITFHFEIAGDLLQESTLELIRSARPGLFQFEIGLQSLRTDTLARVRRRTDIPRLLHNVRALLSCGRAHIHLDLIAGLSGEGLEAFAAGFDQVYALGPHALQLGFLKLLHGSAMREEPEAFPCAFDPSPPYVVTSTPWMTEADFALLRLVEHALDRLHNSGRFTWTLKYVTRGQHQSPFALFKLLGQAMAQQKSPLSLDALTEIVFHALHKLLPHRADILRNLMLLDRLASTPTSVLPGCLKTRHPQFYEVRRAVAARFPRDLRITRTIGFLHGGALPRVAFCDYERAHPVTGRYPVRVVSLQSSSNIRADSTYSS
jgi:hypothetical protein